MHNSIHIMDNINYNCLYNMEEVKMIPMNPDQKKRLSDEVIDLQEKLNKLEDWIKSARSGSINTDVESIHLNEEQAHYMRGYLKILKIKCYQQGVKYER